jgi:hypothetical protein
MPYPEAPRESLRRFVSEPGIPAFCLNLLAVFADDGPDDD